MNILRRGVVVLFGVLAPVSCSTPFFNDMVICYFLDAVLIVYCITATAFYLKEKNIDGGIYQELDRTMDADPYQVLEPSKKKKKADKKKKKTNHAQKRDMDSFESVVPNSS
ncbi:hypothetical protein PAMP_003662 [Pampus punctatissimus]